MNVHVKLPEWQKQIIKSAIESADGKRWKWLHNVRGNSCYGNDDDGYDEACNYWQYVIDIKIDYFVSVLVYININ